MTWCQIEYRRKKINFICSIQYIHTLLSSDFFFSSPFKSNYLRHTHTHRFLFSIYLCNHSSIFIYHLSIHPSNDTKRLDVGVGMHYTITDSTIASKYTHTYIWKENEITYETLVFFLTRQIRFCLYVKQNTILKKRKRQNTDITLDYEKKEGEEKKRQTYIL